MQTVSFMFQRTVIQGQIDHWSEFDKVSSKYHILFKLLKNLHNVLKFFFLGLF